MKLTINYLSAGRVASLFLTVYLHHNLKIYFLLCLAVDKTNRTVKQGCAIIDASVLALKMQYKNMMGFYKKMIKFLFYKIGKLWMLEISEIGYFPKYMLGSWVWIWIGQNKFGLQMAQIPNGISNPDTRPFEIQNNSRHLVKNHLKSRQSCSNFEWLGLQL